MFRIEIAEALGGITMTIEGQFVSHFAETTKQLIVCGKIPAQLTVDISQITCVDSVEETALTWMRLIGAKFVAETSYFFHLCERLHLPLSSKHADLSVTFAGPQFC